MEIAPGFSDKEWKKLLPSLDVHDPECKDKNNPQIKAWDKAIEKFKARIETRFIQPVNRLLEIHKQEKLAVENESDEKRKEELELNRIRPGFATLALDFVIIETIQGFRKGNIDHKNLSGKFIIEFLSKSDEFPEIRENKNPEKFAEFIYMAFRCQVTHKGQTDGEFLINDEGKFSINQHGYNSTTINRTKFHLAVCEAFIRYCNELKEPAETLLRKNFIKKMNSICGVK